MNLQHKRKMWSFLGFLFSKKAAQHISKIRAEAKLLNHFQGILNIRGETKFQINKRWNSNNQNLFNEGYEISLIGQIVIHTAMPDENGTLTK